MKLLRPLLTATLAAAALASCAQPPASAPAEPPSERLARELRDAIGPARCTTDAQCRSIAVGAKACGGPAAYLAWSTEGTDAQRVTELAARQTEAQRREIAASGLRSNCAFVADPGAVCKAGQCQLQSRPGATSS